MEDINKQVLETTNNQDPKPNPEVINPISQGQQPTGINHDTENNPAEKIGAWKGGWLLAKASWSTLKLDKELVLFPIMSSATVIVFLGVLIAAIFFATKGLTNEPPAYVAQGYNYLIGFITYLVIYTITSFFSASIIASALYRFKGGDPSLKYGMGEAKKRFGSLFKFALLASTVGMILRVIQEKAGFAGKIFSLVTEIAWAIVSMFAIAVIVSSDRPIGPIQSVKESTGVFKKVWAKNYTGGLTMGAIFFAIFLLWLVVFGAAITASIILSPGLLFVSAPLAAITLIILISISSALSSIFQAALYHYAQTGESPVNFEKELLHAAFRPKKGWFA